MAISEKKSGKIRVCLSPISLNKVLRREHYHLPTLEDVLPELSEAKKFTTCDLKGGYLHCELDDESSDLTTFATPWGRYRWRRLPFGLKSSSEIFQRNLHQSLEGLEGLRCVADDIIIWAKNDQEHDDRVRKFLQRCKEIGIALNKDKCKFGVTEIKFMGHIVSKDGLKPDPAKIEAVLRMEPPTDKEGVERVRGMVNYLSRFVPRLSSIMKPLNDLTHVDAEWVWTNTHEQAFREIKQTLTQAPVLAYYDHSKELTIQCDASNYGLGAALLQDGKPIAYASRALSDTETCYATIEKEMLAIIFSLEKWHQFTYGRRVSVFSDHKPLESITKKSLDKAPKRLQSMLLRSLAYDIEVRYKEGKKMFLADNLSRAYLPADRQSGQEEFEIVNTVSFLTMPDNRIDEVRKITSQDEILALLRSFIMKGWPVKKSEVPNQIANFFDIRDELGVTDGLIIRGERLVIPKDMRTQIKKDLHIGHLGVDSTLRRAREYVYWPGMSDEVKQWIQKCDVCRKYEKSQPKEPLMSHEIPQCPWEKVGIDLFSIGSKNYVVTVCYRTNYFEIDKLQSTTSKAVIHKLKAHCARYGIPETFVSDGGPQFDSEEFRNFTQKWGITHNITSPYNSKANGKAEAAVKSAKRMLRKAAETGEDEYLALLNIRNTPTQGLDSSPAQRFLNRRTRTVIPTVRSLLQPRSAEQSLEMKQLRQNQIRQAKYYNRTAHELPPLDEGDVVRMKPFAVGDKIWKKTQVTQRLDERSYLVYNDGQIFRRNREHLKKTHETTKSSEQTSPSYDTVRNNHSSGRSPQPDNHQRQMSETTTPLRRTTRKRMEPAKFADYVKK